MPAGARAGRLTLAFALVGAMAVLPLLVLDRAPSPAEIAVEAGRPPVRLRASRAAVVGRALLTELATTTTPPPPTAPPTTSPKQAAPTTTTTAKPAPTTHLHPTTTTTTTTKSAPTTTTTKSALATTTTTTKSAPTTSTTTKPAPPRTTAPSGQEPANVEEGDASWYRSAEPGECAHRKAPMGTTITVTGIRSERSITCRVTDRGPYVEGRVVDLSRGDFDSIGSPGAGVIRVRVTW